MEFEYCLIKYLKNVIEGQTKQVILLVEQAIKEGFSPKEIINEGLLTGMNEVGAFKEESYLFRKF